MLVSVESTDKFDNSTLTVDCSDEEFGTVEDFTKSFTEQQQTNHFEQCNKHRAEVIRSVARDCKDTKNQHMQH